MVGTTAITLLTPEHPVTLARGHCLRYRFAPADCRSCVDHCPHQALSPTPRGLELDRGSCRGCLLCLSACPSGALEGCHLNLAEKLQQLSRHSRPVLGCAGSPSQAHERVPCLGALAHPEVLLAVAALMPQPLQLNLTACAQCPNAAIVAPLIAALKSLEQMKGFPYAGRLELITHAPDLHYQAAGLSRREFFTLFRKKSSATAVRLVDRLAASSPTPSFQNKRLPHFRALLLAAWPEILEDFRPQVRAAFFPRLQISQDCRGCTGCVGICPTGALTPADRSGSPPLVRPELCGACGACSTFCRRQAIQVAKSAATAPR
ncbi:(4Fe-4S)-binding protein [Desulfuromonas versatilis]|uniref:(4Fe-4S)-binding protein n=1 Tax=Desulfuromonas versatilis TaxID=2802975 RepID=A0ABM8HMW7_9BACT|nr:4Fe-4S binding protein [Desulfuromonas versatilis]BCR03705.1 (4Fe-4S)-binding protein [Desulfuromonas versatilis]